MKKFKLFAGLIFFWSLSQISNAQVENLTITGTTYLDTVKYEILNGGNQQVPIGYIITQDQVLMLTQGNAVVPASGMLVIKAKVQGTTASGHTFSIEVIDDNGNRAEYYQKEDIGGLSSKAPWVSVLNPVNDYIVVSIESNSQESFDVVLFTFDGIEVTRRHSAGGEPLWIPTNHLSKGLYFISIRSAAFAINKKVLVK